MEKNYLKKNHKYFSTGDLAFIDKSGFINIKGRIKDIIIRGGINYSPKNIEDIINLSIYVKKLQLLVLMINFMESLL